MAEVYHAPDHWLTDPVTIHVVGAGGTGSQVLDGLASLEATLVRLGHPGFRVTVFDPDEVSRFNLGRQRFTEADIGLSKARVLVHRINLFYGRNWWARAERYEPHEARFGRDQADLLITAVDSVAARVGVAEAGEQRPAFSGGAREVLWLDTGNAADNGQVILGHLSREVPSGKRRLPHVLDLHAELAELGEQEDAPSCSMEAAIAEQEWPVNRAASMVVMDLLWTLFRHGYTKWHGATFGLNPLSVEPLYIDPIVWGLYGYEQAQQMEGRDVA